MKGRTLTFLGILAAIVAAAIIIAQNKITASGIVLTGGILFIIAGLANTIALQRNKAKASGKMFGHVANAASIVLGICMIVFQGSFVPLVSFIFGVLVAMLAVWQFYVLAAAIKPYTLPGWIYTFPILLTASAVYIFVTKGSLPQMPLMLTTGISIAIVGIGCIIEGSLLGAQRRISAKAEKAPANEETEAAKPEAAAEEKKTTEEEKIAAPATQEEKPSPTNEEKQ